MAAAARKAKKVKLAKKEGEIFSRIAPWQPIFPDTRRYEGRLTGKNHHVQKVIGRCFQELRDEK